MLRFKRSQNWVKIKAVSGHFWVIAGYVWGCFFPLGAWPWNQDPPQHGYVCICKYLYIYLPVTSKKRTDVKIRMHASIGITPFSAGEKEHTHMLKTCCYVCHLCYIIQHKKTKIASQKAFLATLLLFYGCFGASGLPEAEDMQKHIVFYHFIWSTYVCATGVSGSEGHKPLKYEYHAKTLQIQ